MSIQPEILRFARALTESVDADHVLLFGSHARNDARADSDVDIIIVSEKFAGVEAGRRSIGLRDLWYAAGGDSPMDLICLTPEEFELAKSRITLVASVLPDAIDLLLEFTTTSAKSTTETYAP